MALTAALAATLALGACSGSVIDQLPEAMGGEPAALPKRPADRYQYPAVHDMPPERAAAPLTDDQQYQLKKSLEAARARHTGARDQDEKAAPAAKKMPDTVMGGRTSGASAKP